MASCSTEQWSTQYTPQAKLTVTESSSTDTTVTLAWTLQYVTHGYTADTNGYGRAWSVTIDGSKVDSGTTNIDGKSTYTVASGTKTVNKTTSSRNVPFSVSFEFDITWTDVYGGTKTASGSIAIDAKTSYIISFNANGGSGAPNSQTKWHGTDLTLSSTKPTKSGYTFQGWSDSANGSKKWDAGGTYTWNQSCTLYAIWSKTITLTYNANGGTGAPSSQSVTIYNATTNYKFTLSSTKPTRTGYVFLGWSTSNTATSSSYAAGGSITLSASDTLYAVWSENKLTVNYYSNYADYCTYKGESISVSANTNIKVHSQDFLYDNSYSGGLSNVQNSNYLYLSRIGYTPTGYWGTSTNGGTLIDEKADYSTGQALAQAFGKNLTNGNASVDVYPQWGANDYTLTLNANGGAPNIQTITLTYNIGNHFGIGVYTPTRLGYEFLGWYTSANGGIKVYDEAGLCTNEGTYWEDNKYIYPDNLTLYAQWKPSGVVYIDNGDTFEPYLIYIDNGTSFDLYLAYIDNGTSWDIIS